MIVLENIDKKYDLGEATVTALDSVSLDIDEGEYIAIMGPSGSGKSTAVTSINCLNWQF